MSFTEKPVFVLVNDIFWGNVCRKVAAPVWQSAVLKDKTQSLFRRKKTDLSVPFYVELQSKQIMSLCR